ncbi:hypothetical protein LBMAG56_47630 [Verrucomicrobiota bacterium]|nr:hypothetical protein LBMAG56_47630 [Verrucomicrobiota bacterium]
MPPITSAASAAAAITSIKAMPWVAFRVFEWVQCTMLLSGYRQIPTRHDSRGTVARRDAWDGRVGNGGERESTMADRVRSPTRAARPYRDVVGLRCRAAQTLSPVQRAKRTGR